MESRPEEQRPRAAGARAEVPDGASPRVRCILSLPESAPRTPADLIEAFSSRPIEVRELVGPFAAMGELVRAERDPSCAIALVVVEPGRFRGDRAAELMRSAGRWSPRAARWIYEHSATPRLRKWIAPGEPALAPEGAKVNGIGPALRDVASAPTLRLTGVGEDADATDTRAGAQRAHEPDDAHTDADALTEEELAMLLGRSEPERAEPDEGPTP